MSTCQHLPPLQFPLSPDPQLEFASLLCLHMLRAALPFTQPSRPSVHKGPSEPLAVPSAILAHLSGLLDSKDTPASLRRLAQEIVVEGVVVFFPDATARRHYLLSMIDSVLVSPLSSCHTPCHTPCGSLPLLPPPPQEDNQPQSWWQKFEALCHHFSKTDSNSLLGLPKKTEEVGGCAGVQHYALITAVTTAGQASGHCCRSQHPQQNAGCCCKRSKSVPEVLTIYIV